MTREQRTARLTVLIDPDKKAVFERLCAIDDVTPSQVIRRLIREFIEKKTGRPWQPGERPEPPPGGQSGGHTLSAKKTTKGR
jgi:hypothetical protein